MRVQTQIDPTTPNPQDSKDEPHSPDDGGSRFIPYVQPWERLADAIKRVTAGGRSREMAQVDLCRAIADGAVTIRASLKKHATRHTTSKKTVLQGTAFEIPPEIKPTDLDWERSCPVKPWIVRRATFSPSGYWHLEWIEVCRADVTNVLCAGKEQDETTSIASSETLAAARESGEMPVGAGPSRAAGPRKPGAAPAARRRGVRPLKFEKARDAMRDDLQQGRLPVAQLATMLEKNLATNYGVSRDTARKARKAVLSE